jgi:hypothetical protein
MKFTLFNRDFSEIVVPPALDFKVQRYSWSDQGGPLLATIEASGDRTALFSMINHLRGAVEIINDLGDPVWWGYVSEVTIHLKEINYGVDMETMFNNVAVAFTNSSLRFTTQWLGDADSIAEYGKKEILISKSEVTEADALQRRDTCVAATKYPIPVIKFSSGDENTATITCRGWFQTLNWEYYPNATGKEAYETTGTGGREIGEDDRPQLAQSFQIAATTAWAASSIWLRPWKQGTGGNLPTDNVLVYLKSDIDGVPGEVLASASIGAADIGTNADWLEFPLNTSVTLEPETTYWIQVTRSGGVDETAYYMLDTNRDCGYERGKMYLWNTPGNYWGVDMYGANWGDLLFRVTGDTQNTDQIRTLISTVGQFFLGTIVEDESTIESNPYRAGDTVGGYELGLLLDTGTANSRRLLCEVTRNRYLKVYEEPAAPANPRDSYALTEKGELLSNVLTAIDQSLCPVGVWCHLQDVIPASVDLSMISDPSLFLIEEAEYDVDKAKYSIKLTRNQSDSLDIGGTVQG